MHNFTHRKVTPDAQLLKQLEVAAVLHAPWVKQLGHLVTELECSTFKAHVGPWANLQDEPKIDVDQVPLRVHEDVAVVAVFRLRVNFSTLL